MSDEAFRLPAIPLSRREVFSFSIARKLLTRFEGTPLEMNMRSVLEKISQALEGTVLVDN